MLATYFIIGIALILSWLIVNNHLELIHVPTLTIDERKVYYCIMALTLFFWPLTIVAFIVSGIALFYLNRND